MSLDGPLDKLLVTPDAFHGRLVYSDVSPTLIAFWARFAIPDKICRRWFRMCGYATDILEEETPMEQEIEAKGYVHPEALVTTEWVQENLDDTENFRIVESDE